MSFVESDRPSVLNSAFEQTGWSKYHSYVFAACATGMVNDMTWVANFIVINDYIKNWWDLSSLQQGVLAGSLSLGMFAGAIISGYIADRYGRMWGFKGTIVVTLIGSIPLLLAQNFEMVLIANFILGLGGGGDLNLAGTILSDYCPKEKGYMITALTVFWTTGAGWAYLFAIILLQINWQYFPIWRQLVVVSIVMTFVFFLVRLPLHETPKWLIKKGRFLQANKILNRINTRKNPQLLSDSLLQNLYEKENQITNKQLALIFRSPHALQTFALSVALFFHAYNWGCINFFLPTYMENSGANLSQTQQILVLLLQQFSTIFSVLISYNLVDTRMGRKGVMLIGYSLAAVFSILFYFSHAFWSIMVSIVGLNVCMMIGVGALYTANTESYPTHIKSIGAGFNISMCKVGVILASVVSGGLMTLDWGESAVLISIPVFFGVLCGAVLLQKDTRYLKHFN